MNGSGLQQGLVCYNHNKIGHIAKYYREMNEKSINLAKKISLKEKLKILWIKKSDEDTFMNGSAPSVGVDCSGN